MKITTISILIFILSGFSFLFGGDWERVSIKPRSQDLHDIKIINKNLVISAGNYGLIKVSVDAGENWETVRGKSDHEHLHGIDFSGNNIFVVGNNGTILKSTNEGKNWIKQEKFTDFDLKSIAFHGKDGLIVGENGIIFKTIDQGMSWEKIGEEWQTNLNEVFFVNENIAITFGDNGLILKSVDKGNNWNKIDLGIKSNLLCYSPNFEEKIIIGGDSYTLIESEDYFNSWNIIETANAAMIFKSLLYINEDLLLSGGVFSLSVKHAYSTDGGQNWIIGKKSNVPINEFDYDNEFAFLCGNQGTIVKIDPGIEIEPGFWNFNEIVEYGDKKFTLSLINGFDNKNLISADHNDIYISNDSEITWNLILESTHKVIDARYINKNLIIIFLDSSKFVQEDDKSYQLHWPVINSSTDCGTTWNQKIFDEGLTIRESSFHGKYGIAWGAKEYIKTTDFGESWERFSSPQGLTIFDVQVISDGVVFILAKDDSKNWVFFKTNDDFITEERHKIELLNGFPGSIDFVDAETGWISVGNAYNNSPNKIFKTTNGGGEWFEIESFDLPFDVGLQKIKFADYNHGFCIAPRGHIFQTTDGGASWFENFIETEGFINLSIYYPNKKLAYFGDGTGIYRLENDIISGIKEKDYISELSLHPNPATDHIFIDTDILSGTIEIYNMLGIKVAEKAIASGREKIDVSSLPAGMYFLKAGDEVRKFVKR